MAIKTNKNVKPFGMADKIGYAFGDFGNDFTFICSPATPSYNHCSPTFSTPESSEPGMSMLS